MQLKVTYLLGVIFCLYCCLATLSALPVAAENKAAESRDKRSGEVIFFENSDADEDSKSKRSDRWLPVSSSEKDSADVKEPVVEDLKAKESKGDNGNDLDDSLLAGLEEWAFNEALNFLIDRLISEVYEEEINEELDEELDEEYLLNSGLLDSAEAVEETTTPQVADVTIKTKFDKQADALASLIAKQSQKNEQEPPKKSQRLQQVPVKVAMRAEQPHDMSVKMSMNGEQTSSSEDQYSDDKDQLTMDTPEGNANEEPSSQADKEEDGEDVDIDAESLLEYFEYLRQLKKMEDSLKDKSFAKSSKKEETPQDKSSSDGKPQIRKRRSLSDQWMEPREEGVYFNTVEAGQLKQLLLSLAKDRLLLQELVSYLEEGKPSSFLDDGYSGAQGGNDKELESLAYKLNQRPRPSYGSKRALGYNPY